MAISWNGWCWQLSVAGFLAMGGALALGGGLSPIADLGDCARAQITPDGTLPNNSIVTPQGNTRLIEGGTQAGANLFHSFEQFSVPTEGAAYFNNALNIQNIISRVTGGSISNIDGLLRANGTANLFLLNPNGIIFGPNASLNIGGSFAATTANAIQFGNQGFFSASAPNVPPVLTVNPSAFLFNQIASGNIKSQSIAPAGLAPSGSATFGLRVPDGRSLLFVGGDISVDGLGFSDAATGNSGGLRAFNGLVDLGGLAGAGIVELNVNGNNLNLSYPAGVQRADVSLSNSAGVDVIAWGKGSIAVNARNLDILGGSYLDAGIGAGLEAVDSQAGDITLNVTGAVTLADGFIFNYVDSGAVGNAGNLTIDTGRLSLSDGAQVGSLTLGAGNTGNLTVRASEVQLIGTSADGQFASGLLTAVNPTGRGTGGELTIETRRLSVSNGAQVNTSTTGLGNAGNLTVHASDSVELRGEGSRGPGGLFAQVNISLAGETGTGNGGKLTIETGRLSVSNGSKVQATTYGEGDAGDLLIQADVVEVVATPTSSYSTGVFAEVGDPSLTGIPGGANLRARGDGGDLTIEAERLSIRDGGQVSVYTRSDGNAGRLSVRASDSVEVVGTNAFGPSFLATAVSSTATGQGGDLTIQTGQLNVQDGAEVNVSSLGPGNAGDLLVQADNLFLNNQGRLQASTASGEGGNINLQMGDLILMRRNSLISAEARGTGNGGNITSNAPFIVAVPSENNDIVANAVQGQGGKINITTQGIYGLEYRDQLTEESDITASSEFGVDGVVDINTPDIDPSQGLATLPAELVDASGLIAQGCGSGGRQGESKFIITGRGELPIRPTDVHISHYPTGTVRSIPSSSPFSETPRSSVSASDPSTNLTGVSAPTQIVEAQGWMVNSKGEVVLTAQAPNDTPNIPWMNPATCHTP